jgi:hypothetical protein
MEILVTKFHIFYYSNFNKFVYECTSDVFSILAKNRRTHALLSLRNKRDFGNLASTTKKSDVISRLVVLIAVSSITTCCSIKLRF